MPKLWITMLLAVPLFGQLDSGTLTVTVSRTITVQPDQVGFSASVLASVDSPLDEIVSTLAPAGATTADLAAAVRNNGFFTYYFAWVVPVSQVTEVIAALQSQDIAFQL